MRGRRTCRYRPSRRCPPARFYENLTAEGIDREVRFAVPMPALMTYIGLLRAVNLGARNKVTMSDLCKLLDELGMQDARSLMQSGNVVFRGGSSTTTHLERLLQDATQKRIGLRTDFFVRTSRQWEAIIAANPFPEEAERDPSHLLVIFLKDLPDPAAVAALQKAI